MMQPFTGDIHRVIRPLGIKLVSADDYRANMDRTKVCCCRATLKKIARTQGEGHLSLVLKMIVETDGNECELYSDTILAVSGLFASFPELERMNTLYDWFDGIDLHSLRWKAKDSKVYPVHKAMQTLLVLEFWTAIHGGAA